MYWLPCLEWNSNKEQLSFACIDDLLDWPNGAKYFNQIDFKSRIHIADEDIESSNEDQVWLLQVPSDAIQVVQCFISIHNLHELCFPWKVRWIHDHLY